MAARNHISRHPDSVRGFRDGPRPVLTRGLAPMHFHPMTLEEEIEIQRREMHRIISENRHAIDDNTHLQRELTAAKDEIHRLGQIIPKLRADKEAHTRELFDRGLKLEAELRASEPVRAEVVQLRAEVQKLNSSRQELTTQIKGLTKDVNRLEAENKQLIAMRADIDGIRSELVEARRAFEFEKKANEEQIEQKQAMENNLISMAREIEKLRAELLNTERRACGLGGSAYGLLNGCPDMRYPGGAFDNDYGGAWGHYDKHGPPRR